MALVRRTREWDACCSVHTARGYFKVVLRRQHDDEKDSPFFWALEWNKSIRVLRMIRHPDEHSPVEKDLPDLDFRSIGEGLRYRQETALADEDDVLFE